jgi:hypothetical protein
LQFSVWLRKSRKKLRIPSQCLLQLREKFAGLDTADREALRPVPERTGCWQHLG